MPFTLTGLVTSKNDTAQSVATTRGFAQADLANPPFANETQTGGTLIITKAGDYALVDGIDFVRKMVIRILVTKPGAFFHLPDFGVGFREKEPLPLGSAVKLKEEIRRQILKFITEVDEAGVTLIIDEGLGITTCQVVCRVKKTGQEIPVTFPSPLPNHLVAL